MKNDTFKAPLRSAVLEITNRCNLRCVHCASGSGKARREELSTDEWLAILAEIASLGGEEVTLIGGEIFLCRDWLQIAQRVRDLGMKLIIITNGLLVDDRTFSSLLSLDPHIIGISLDGATRESYRAVRGVDGFDRVWSLLQRLEATGHPRINAITTFCRRNIGEFDNLATLLDGTGITWQIQLASDAGARATEELLITLDDYRELTRRMTEILLSDRQRTLWLCPMDDFGYFPIDPTESLLHQAWPGCRAARSVIGIRSNGDLLGCLSLGDDFVETNIRQTPLTSAWRSPQLFGNLRHKSEQLTGACRRCPEAGRCQAGCSNIAHSATGAIFDNPYCIRRLEAADLLSYLDGDE